jgi:hypothetical protein
MDKIISRRMLNSLLIPMTVTFIQMFFKYLLEKESGYIGISLSAIALGQIFPYISYDHLMINKVMSYKPEHTQLKTELKTTYKPSSLISIDKIEKLKILTNILFIGILVIFIVTTGLGLKGDICYHNCLGFFAVSLSTYYQIWA